MSTLVWFHAHPDDESLLNSGSVMRAAAEGHRNVLVVATNGEWGEVPDDLAPGETLVQRRRAETEASAAVLGYDRIAWLGYADSGMTGWEQNQRPDCFLQADVEAAAERLATILRAEAADVLVTYDWHGNYGHPDHIRVHVVGHRAAVLAGTARVFDATINRDALVRARAQAQAAGIALDADLDPTAPADDGNPVGMPEAELTHAVDVGPFVARKRASIACHRSQTTDTTMFLQMPEPAFVASFGTEWFIERGVPAGVQHRWLLD